MKNCTTKKANQMKSPNAFTMNNLTPFSTRNTQSNTSVNYLNTQNTNNLNTVSNPNLNTPNNTSKSPNKTGIKNVYNSEYIHDAIHKGKIYNNSHSPYSRKSNPNNLLSNSNKSKRKDHI